MGGLAGPTVLAFFGGGYFTGPRAWAGAVTWVLVLLAVVVSPGGLPRGRNSWLAIGGLALLAAWTLLSVTWAPIRGTAYHAGQLVFIYLGAVLAAVMLLRGRAVRLAEPMLVLGALVVIGYGLSQRVLPGLAHLTASLTAFGRLEQPLSYWNGMGELAAIGFVLAARLAGDVTRPAALRAPAAAAAPVLGLGLYLSFSRGALFAGLAGVLALLVAAPAREQLRSLVLALTAAALVAVAAAPFPWVTRLGGLNKARASEGAVVLAVLLVVVLASGLLQLRLARRPMAGSMRLPDRAPWIVLALACIGLAGAILLGAKETSKLPSKLGTARLATFQSDRYAYWDVAINAFAQEPVRGVGAGGWAVEWLRHRKIQSFAVDAHSLPMQTLAELGLVGAVLLASLIAGVALACHAAYRRAGPLAAGPIAALVVYIAHAPLDWDWELPALTLVAAVLAGLVLSLNEVSPRDAERGEHEQELATMRPLAAGNTLSA